MVSRLKLMKSCWQAYTCTAYGSIRCTTRVLYGNGIVPYTSCALLFAAMAARAGSVERCKHQGPPGTTRGINAAPTTVPHAHYPARSLQAYPIQAVYRPGPVSRPSPTRP